MSEPAWVPLGTAPMIPWQIVFTALASEPPGAGYATLDTRNGHPVLDYDAAANEGVMFRGVLPNAYAGRGLNVKLIWAATTAVAGNVVWAIGVERINAGGQDLDANSFGPTISATATCDTVSGETTETVIPISAGASMDGLLAGEMFRLQVYRDAVNAADTMAGDAELLAVVITEQ